VLSAKTKPEDGGYSLQAVKANGAFDVAYLHSAYEPVFVTRLAQENDQVIVKVIYRKGEKKPVGAIQERFQSARRFSFLAMSIENPDSRGKFVGQFSEGIWGDLADPIEKSAVETPSSAMLGLLREDQSSTLKLRVLLGQSK